MVEKSSGRIIAGVVAPTRGNLIEWLEDHPTFEVLKPGKYLYLLLFTIEAG